MGQRRRARECALQMLYQIDQTGNGSEEVFRQFWLDQPAADEIRAFTERLVLGVIDRRGSTDALIGGAADNWRIERMAVVDRNILRLAVFEMLHLADAPPAVVIDEAIEIAKKFGSADSGTFINGILDAIRLQMDRGQFRRPDGEPGSS